MTRRPLIALVLVLASGGASQAGENRNKVFCDAVRKVAAGAATGFVTVRGPLLSGTGNPRMDTHTVRMPLPDATGCSVSVPRLGRARNAAYACTFSGGVDVRRTMGRLVRRTAHCVDVAVGNPPRLKEGPDSPTFYFPAGAARFDFSGARVPGQPGRWTVTVSISKGPNQPRRPLV